MNGFRCRIEPRNFQRFIDDDRQRCRRIAKHLRNRAPATDCDPPPPFAPAANAGLPVQYMCRSLPAVAMATRNISSANPCVSGIDFLARLPESTLHLFRILACPGRTETAFASRFHGICGVCPWFTCLPRISVTDTVAIFVLPPPFQSQPAPLQILYCPSSVRRDPAPAPASRRSARQRSAARRSPAATGRCPRETSV